MLHLSHDVAEEYDYNWGYILSILVHTVINAGVETILPAIWKSGEIY